MEKCSILQYCVLCFRSVTCEKNVCLAFEEVNELFYPVCFFRFLFYFCLEEREGGGWCCCCCWGKWINLCHKFFKIDGLHERKNCVSVTKRCFFDGQKTHEGLPPDQARLFFFFWVPHIKGGLLISIWQTVPFYSPDADRAIRGFDHQSEALPPLSKCAIRLFDR